MLHSHLVRRILASVTSPRAEKCSRRRLASASGGRFLTQTRETAVSVAASCAASVMAARTGPCEGPLCGRFHAGNATEKALRSCAEQRVGRHRTLGSTCDVRCVP